MSEYCCGNSTVRVRCYHWHAAVVHTLSSRHSSRVRRLSTSSTFTATCRQAASPSGEKRGKPCRTGLDCGSTCAPRGIRAQQAALVLLIWNFNGPSWMHAMQSTHVGTRLREPGPQTCCIAQAGLATHKALRESLDLTCALFSTQEITG